MYEQVTMSGIKAGSNSKKGSTFPSRVNERIVKYGVESITEAEIISVLTGIPVDKLNELIAEHGVIHLGRMIESLDITDAQRRKLALVYEVSRKIGVSDIKEKEALDSSTKSGRYFVSLLSTKPIEEFVVALLDSQNKLIKTVTAFKGTINEAPIYPREVVKAAVVNNAVSVILAHNHPGGSKNPSSADISSTEKLKEALATVGIKVVDHVIVCGDSYISFAERGLL